MVLSKRQMPWYDERIHDGSLGRQLHVEHLHALKFGFVVHPTAFLVRQPLLEDAQPAAKLKTDQADVSHDFMPSCISITCLQHQR